MKIRCIIVEDQQPAQKILKRYIEETTQLDLVGTFFNALDALDFVRVDRVDLMFLDVHLPKISGVDFLKLIPNPPKVIFTTAFSDYALTGYELNAVDYLLKPFDFPRFYQAVSKAQDLLRKNETLSAPSTEPSVNYYFAKLDRELVKVNFDEIRFIQASGDFVNVYLTDSKLFLSENLKFWEEMLPVSRFSKVHKSYIVQLDKIDKVTGNTILIETDKIPIGRAYRKDFMAKIM